MNLPPLLAATDSLWPFVIAGVFLLFKWLGSMSSDDESKKSSTGSIRPKATPRPAGEEEAERARKFMEALGLPATNLPPAPVARRAEPDPAIAEERRRRKAAEKAEKAAAAARRQGRSSVPPPPRTIPAPRPAYEPPSLDSLETTTARVENIHLPELKTPEYKDFQTVAGGVTAMQMQEPKIGHRSAAAKRQQKSGVAIRDMLQRRESLRQLVLLREILGPPKGLQSGLPASTFPST